MNFTAKVTWLGKCYGCRVFLNDKLILEGRCKSRIQIGAVFRDLLRTLDKLGGNEFTNAARYRKFKPGNLQLNAKHIWYR